MSGSITQHVEALALALERQPGFDEIVAGAAEGVQQGHAPESDHDHPGGTFSAAQLVEQQLLSMPEADCIQFEVRAL